MKFKICQGDESLLEMHPIRITYISHLMEFEDEAREARELFKNAQNQLKSNCAVIMKNLASALIAEHHCLKWCSRAKAVTRFFIITAQFIPKFLALLVHV